MRLNALSEIPAVSAESLGTLVKIPGVGGLGNAGVFRGALNGRQVVVKVSDPVARTERDVLNEARMTMVLNRIGLGAEFHGMVELPDGGIGLVIDYVEGIALPFRRSTLVPTGYLMRSHAREILNAGELIDRAGIRYAPDMQFILTPQGRAVLVDPEFFHFEVPATRTLELPHHPVGNARALSREVLGRIGVGLPL